MSQELERVYTINLGKVKLSQSQHRAVRAINMIREFARHHMKVEEIKIEEELAQSVWSRGVRNPPRKVRVRMSKTDEGYILVSQYDEEVESKVIPEKETKKITDEVKPVSEIEDSSDSAPKKEDSAKVAPKKEKAAPKKEKAAPKKEKAAPKKN